MTHRHAPSTYPLATASADLDKLARNPNDHNAEGCPATYVAGVVIGAGGFGNDGTSRPGWPRTTPCSSIAWELGLGTVRANPG